MQEYKETDRIISMTVVSIKVSSVVGNPVYIYICTMYLLYKTISGKGFNFTDWKESLGSLDGTYRHDISGGIL